MSMFEELFGWRLIRFDLESNPFLCNDGGGGGDDGGGGGGDDDGGGGDDDGGADDGGADDGDSDSDSGAGDGGGAGAGAGASGASEGSSAAADAASDAAAADAAAAAASTESSSQGFDESGFGFSADPGSAPAAGSPESSTSAFGAQEDAFGGYGVAGIGGLGGLGSTGLGASPGTGIESGLADLSATSQQAAQAAFAANPGLGITDLSTAQQQTNIDLPEIVVTASPPPAPPATQTIEPAGAPDPNQGYGINESASPGVGAGSAVGTAGGLGAGAPGAATGGGVGAAGVAAGTGTGSASQGTSGQGTGQGGAPGGPGGGTGTSAGPAAGQGGTGQGGQGTGGQEDDQGGGNAGVAGATGLAGLAPSSTPFERAAQNPVQAQFGLFGSRSGTPTSSPVTTPGRQDVPGFPAFQAPPPAPPPGFFTGPATGSRGAPAAAPAAPAPPVQAPVRGIFGWPAPPAPLPGPPAPPAPPAPPSPPARNLANNVDLLNAQQALSRGGFFGGRGFVGGFPGSSTAALGLPAAPSNSRAAIAAAPLEQAQPSQAPSPSARDMSYNIDIPSTSPTQAAPPAPATPAAPVNPTVQAPQVNPTTPPAPAPATPAAPSPALQAMIETQIQGRSPVATSLLGLRQSAPVPPDPRTAESTIGRDTAAAIGRAAQQALQAIEVPGYVQALTNPERMGHLPANPGIQSYTSPPTSQPIGPLTASPTVAVSPPTALSPALTTPNPVATSQLGLPAPASPAPPFAPGVPAAATPATPSPQSVAQAIQEANFFGGRGLGTPEVAAPSRAAPQAPTAQAVAQRGIDPMLDPNPVMGRQAQRGMVPETARDPREANFMDLAARGLPSQIDPGRVAAPPAPAPPAPAPPAPGRAAPEPQVDLSRAPAPTLTVAAPPPGRSATSTSGFRGGEGGPIQLPTRGSSAAATDQMSALSAQSARSVRAQIEADYLRYLRSIGAR